VFHLATSVNRSPRTRSWRHSTATTAAAVPDVGGFFHLGRFASEYLAMFGEHPSATLRRRAC
jgi:hypothetical protein